MSGAWGIDRSVALDKRLANSSEPVMSSGSEVSENRFKFMPFAPIP